MEKKKSKELKISAVSQEDSNEFKEETDKLKVDINKFKEETDKLKDEWNEIEKDQVYQEKLEVKKTPLVPGKQKKPYLLYALGAATFFAAGILAGIGLKSSEPELRQYKSNALARVTNAFYAIKGETPNSTPQEMQTKGLAEQLEHLSDTLPKDEFANLNADLEVVLEKYSRANNNTIKFEGGN